MKVYCWDYSCKFNKDMRCRRTGEIRLDPRRICRSKEPEEQNRMNWMLISNDNRKGER